MVHLPSFYAWDLKSFLHADTFLLTKIWKKLKGFSGVKKKREIQSTERKGTRSGFNLEIYTEYGTKVMQCKTEIWGSTVSLTVVMKKAIDPKTHNE